MIKYIFLSIFLCYLTGCSSKLPDRTSPQGAFARLNPCVSSDSYKCLFYELDRESRWSFSTISKIITKVHNIIKKDYPDKVDYQALFGAWAKVAKGQDTYERFEIFCRQQDCINNIKKGFGPVKKVTTKTDHTATIVTIRGSEYNMHKIEGNWGLSTWKSFFEAEQIRLTNVLRQIEKNARELKEQEQAIETL